MLSLIPIAGLPLIAEGDPLTELITNALWSSGETLRSGDVLVVAQKIVSKSEGRLVKLDDVQPSVRARELADQSEKDPRIVELILQESREIVRVRPGLIIVEDCRGFICANAGIDRSNVDSGAAEVVALLPRDPDSSADALRRRIEERSGAKIAVIINDSHGRAFREGTVGVAIGVSGITAITDRRGDSDLTGYTLEHTIIGLADEIAAAASLLMGAADEGIPAVLIRGLSLPAANGSAEELQRPRELDLFR